MKIKVKSKFEVKQWNCSITRKALNNANNKYNTFPPDAMFARNQSYKKFLGFSQFVVTLKVIFVTDN